MSLFIIVGGDLYAIIENNMGRFGTADAEGLIKISSMTSFTAVSCSESHTMALDINGDLWGYGDNKYGGLGLGDNIDRDVFTKISSETIFVAVSCGDNFTIALDTDGYLWSTGSNQHGQLGLTSSNLNVLTKISHNTFFTSISCGNSHAKALDDGGNIWSSGIIDPPLPEFQNSIVNGTFYMLPSETSFVFVSSGGYHLAAIDINGNLWTCGSNSEGALGLGDCDDRFILTKVPCDFIPAQVSCGSWHTCVIDDQGKLWISGEVCFRGVDIFTRMDNNDTFHLISSTEENILALDIDNYLWTNHSKDLYQLIKISNFIIDSLSNVPFLEKKTPKSANSCI